MIQRSHSPQETERFAQQLALDIRPPKIVLLRGPLGAGKSVFARALIRALSANPDLEVPSPTFTLVQIYDTPMGPLYHFDLYRLKTPDEIFELGWEEAVHGSIALVEWPERLGPFAPRAALDIHIHPLDNTPEAREILITDDQA